MLIGQFGLIWLLLAAPIVAISVDLVRYIHGRLSEPPRPAGVLPGRPPRDRDLDRHAGSGERARCLPAGGRATVADGTPVARSVHRALRRK